MHRVGLVVPAEPGMIQFVQQSARWFIDKGELSEKQRLAIELAIEEIMLLLVRYAFAEGAEEGSLEVDLELDETALRLTIACRALPFDFSMVPEHRPGQVTNDGALSAALLKSMVDRYRLVNGGKDGYRVELEWLRPLRHIADLAQQALQDAKDREIASSCEAAEITEIRPLREEDALALARLVYRSYGYSYISDYIYYPERIAARLREGRLQSWVAVSSDGELAAHAALVLDRADACAAEWGLAVVDPRWRGRGLMKKVSERVINSATDSNLTLLFGHAVTNHPFTLKTCASFGLAPSALLLAFAPDDLKFRHIQDALRQRESLFTTIRLLKPLPNSPVHLPPRHASTLKRLARGAGFELQESAATVEMSAKASATLLETALEPAVNVAFVNVRAAGPDHAAAIAQERRRLCREKVDVIYLNIDLACPHAPEVVAAAEASGFFLAGLCPMQPWPYALRLQYLNNLTLDGSAIHAVGEQATWLKDLVLQEHGRAETIG